MVKYLNNGYSDRVMVESDGASTAITTSTFSFRQRSTQPQPTPPCRRISMRSKKQLGLKVETQTAPVETLNHRSSGTNPTAN